MARRPPGQNVFAQVLGFFCCVGLPALMSAMAPVSVVELVREPGVTTAKISNRLFYAIPYRRAVVDDVRTVDDRFHAGELVRDTGSSGRGSRSESESFLVLQGSHSFEEVPVSPVNVRSIVERAKGFVSAAATNGRLASAELPLVERAAVPPTHSELRLVMVANWKFGVFLPLLLSPLLVLYIVGVLLTIWRWIRKIGKA